MREFYFVCVCSEREREVSGLAGLSLTLLDHPLLSIDTIHERLGRTEALPHARAIASLFQSRFEPRAPPTINKPHSHVTPTRFLGAKMLYLSQIWHCGHSATAGTAPASGI